MNVIHIVDSLDTREGGLATAVPMLSVYLQKEGVNSIVVSVMSDVNEKNLFSNELKTLKAPLTFSRKLKYAKSLAPLIESAICKDSILHVHGLWVYPAYIGYKISRTYNLPLVVSTHGMIYNWCLKQNRYVKRIAMMLFQREMLKYANIVHITEPNEEVALRNLGVNTRVALVPNGVEINDSPAYRDDGIIQRIKYDSEKKYILFLGRIVHNKGLHYLLSSYESLSLKEKGVEVIVAGRIEDRGYYRRLNKLDGVRFVGTVNENEKQTLFDISFLFVLPSRSENFGMVIAEAMVAKLPVVTTKGTPWKEIEEYDAGWWVELTQENIDRAIDEAVRLSSKEISQKGENGYNLIQKYEWSVQAKKMKSVYNNLDEEC